LGITGISGLPLRPSFRHAFTDDVHPLGPCCLPGSSPELWGPHAAYRFMQLNGPTSTPSSTPNPTGYKAPTRKQRTMGDDSSCEPRQPSFIRPSGTAVRIDDVYVPPTATTARRGGLTSTCRARTPLVVNRCRGRTRKTYSTNDRAVYGLPFGNRLTELVVPKHDSPYRVASCASSRKVTQSCRTQGAFLLLSPRKSEVDLLWLRRSPNDAAVVRHLCNRFSLALAKATPHRLSRREVSERDALHSF